MILRADARSIPLADGCVQCVVTSPPYFGLRDYGVVGQIGLEESPEEYVATMVQVFREVRRVLRDDGTVWLNLGDSYSRVPEKGGSGTFNGRNGAGDGYGDAQRIKREPEGSSDGLVGRAERAAVRVGAAGLKPKDLCMIPARVALALQADGWWLRSDIIWAKKNPMPGSQRDRCTSSHEYVFMLAKSARYFFDADAVAEPSVSDHPSGNGYKRDARLTFRDAGGPRGSEQQWAMSPTRAKRDVWWLNSEPFPDAHFATFPQKLVEPCILAGTSAKGCCAKCGAPWVRVTDVDYIAQSPISATDKARNPAQGNNFATRALGRASKLSTTKGWRPTCSHGAPVVPCTVLDPFLGSGTVGKVCERLGRRWVGLELSAPYIEIARKRTAQCGLFTGFSEPEGGI
jgi:DNA modification methylase